MVVAIEVAEDTLAEEAGASIWTTLPVLSEAWPVAVAEATVAAVVREEAVGLGTSSVD